MLPLLTRAREMLAVLDKDEHESLMHGGSARCTAVHSTPSTCKPIPCQDECALSLTGCASRSLHSASLIFHAALFLEHDVDAVHAPLSFAFRRLIKYLPAHVDDDWDGYQFNMYMAAPCAHERQGCRLYLGSEREPYTPLSHFLYVLSLPCLLCTHPYFPHTSSTFRCR